MHVGRIKILRFFSHISHPVRSNLEFGGTGNGFKVSMQDTIQAKTHIKRNVESPNNSTFSALPFRSQTLESVITADDPSEQAGLLFVNLPADFCSDKSALVDACKLLGMDLPADMWFIMKTLLGEATGKAIVLTELPFPRSQLRLFPSGTEVHIMDSYDIENFIEKCERLVKLSEDLHWLAQPGHAQRILTITEIPSSYGRRELRDILKRYADVDVFNASNEETGMAWVVCPSIAAANRALDKIQELPVPKRVQYASLFGCAFLWSQKSSMFISHEALDFQLDRSIFQIFLTGWEPETTEEDFCAVLQQVEISPVAVRRLSNPIDQQASFFVELDNMEDTKAALMKFHKLKTDWKLPDSKILYGYPRMADVRWLDEKNGHKDQEEEGDSDLEEPIGE